MKIVITGALGHIGSALIRKLPEYFSNLELVLIDSMMTQRYCSLFNLTANVNYSFIEKRIQEINLEKIFSNVNIVIHLAAITDAAGSFDQAMQVERNNFETTKQVSEACLNLGANLITISSTSVYGTNDALVDESTSVMDLKPQSPYAETKLKEEELIKTLCKKEGLKATICRFGTIFGVSPGMRFHTAVNKFCWQASWDQPLTVWSSAYNQVRPYLHLQDACNSIIHIIEKSLFHGKIYNVLTINASLEEVIEEIKKHKPNIKIEMVDNAIMNQLSYEVSTQKFLGTGFEYTGELSVGISDIMKILK